MTVADMIRKLQGEDPARLVVLQRDAEGNGYSPAADCWRGVYLADSTWHGDAYQEGPLTDAERAQGYTEEDLCQDPDGQPALFLVPTN